MEIQEIMNMVMIQNKRLDRIKKPITKPHLIIVFKEFNLQRHAIKCPNCN
jgi:hypothetical protein